MASQTSDPGTAGQGPISFDVERVIRTEPGRLEVQGRWYGVRGRRFVRPALTQVSGGSERRWLAELEHKPWAAEDGEQWIAVFALDAEVDEVAELELSVAPDITVKLGDGVLSPRRPRRKRSSAAILRASPTRADAAPGGPTLSERHQEIQRLNSRLIAVGQQLEREREQRARAGEELERERSLRISDEDELERERLRRDATLEELETRSAELEAKSAELDTAAAELETKSAELDIAAAELETKSAELDTAAAELEAKSAELESARRELSEERARSERLRSQLARERAPAAAPQTQEFSAFVSAESEAVPPARTRREPEHEPPARREPPAGREAPTRRDPSTRRESPTRREPPAPVSRSHPAPRPERPLNPALRSQSNWAGRLLALLVILVVIAAVILVIRTTVKP
ncbi:MAG TPA: hypothetical protein VGL51_04355 [Solirubrobacteraceae bacterium]|jgi:hypothetical protein